MKLLAVIVILAGIAIIGSRLTFLNRRLPMGFRHILFTGIEYVFLGMILGKVGFDVLDQNTLKSLEPFVLFTLTWVGFLYGLQFEFHQVKKLPRFYFSITALQALVTFVLMWIPLFFVLRMIYSEMAMSHLLTIATVLSSAGCCTAQSALAIVCQSNKFENRKLVELLRYVSSVDGLFGLLFFTLALCLFPGLNNTFSLAATGKWLGISICIGSVPALILINLNRYKFSQQEFLLFLIGSVMFCAGLTEQGHYSPLISGLTCGVITANCCRHRTRALTTAVHAEKSIYIILLLLLGAGWSWKVDYALALVLAYFIVRVVAKLIAAYSATRIIHLEYHSPWYLGLGLASEGGLAIVIIFDFKHIYHVSIVDPLVTVIVFSTLLSELVGPRLIMTVLKKDNDRQNLPIEQEGSITQT